MPIWFKSLLLSGACGLTAQLIIGDKVRHKDYIEGLPLWADLLCTVLMIVSAMSFFIAVIAIIAAIQDIMLDLDNRIHARREAEKRKRGEV